MTLPASVFAKVERLAKKTKRSRSNIVAQILQIGFQRQAANALREELREYYAAERDLLSTDDELISKAQASLARQLDFDR